MKAELRRIHSPDVDDLASWIPETNAWAILLQLFVGPADGPGEETFDLTVCTPQWIAARVEDEGILDGRHHLVVASYDYGRIEEYLRRRVNSVTAQSWNEAAIYLGRLGRWEFEDYRE